MRDWRPAKCLTNLKIRIIRIKRTRRTIFPALPMISKSCGGTDNKGYNIKTTYGWSASDHKLFGGSTEKVTLSGLTIGTMTFERQLWYKKGAVKKILKILLSYLITVEPSEAGFSLECCDQESSLLQQFSISLKFGC